jgi:hypothetical protein
MTTHTPRQRAIHEAGHAAPAHVLEQLATLARTASTGVCDHLPAAAKPPVAMRSRL